MHLSTLRGIVWVVFPVLEHADADARADSSLESQVESGESGRNGVVAVLDSLSE
jgi:hypothetical protein